MTVEDYTKLLAKARKKEVEKDIISSCKHLIFPFRQGLYVCANCGRTFSRIEGSK